MKNRNLLFSTRLLFLVGTAIYILTIFFLFGETDWVADFHLYNILGVLAFVLSLTSGILALIKFDTRNKTNYVFVGVGLLGASALEAYYMVIKGLYGFSTPFEYNPSSAVLAIFFFISWVFGRTDKTRFVLKDESKLYYLIFSSVSALVAVFIFVFASFGRGLLISISSFFFFLSFIAYLYKGSWRNKYFEFLFLASLILFFASDFLFLSRSSMPLDLMFFLSCIVRISGYALSFTGLLMSTHNAFIIAEKASETSEVKLEASIDNLPLGYALFNKKGDVEKVNNELVRILLEKEAESATKVLTDKLKVLDYTKGSGDKRLIDVAKEIAYKGRYLMMFVTPVYVGTDYSGLVVILRDITDQKLLDKTKDEFIALASHELRTPISIVKGNVELLDQLYSESIKDEDFKEIMDDICSSSSRMLDIVEEFLDVSSLEQKKMVFKKENFNLVNLIRSVIGEFRPLVKNKDLELVLKSEGMKDLSVFADKDRTKEVLLNLLSNAIKFTGEGEIEISLKVKDGFVETIVKDTGRGINPKGQKMLFKKFQQVGEDFLKHDSSQGVGLGLYISKMILERMGGEIYLVKSKEGKGSTFAFTLPISGS